MAFNSYNFILLFAPIVIIVYYLSLKFKKKEISQIVLILASIIFYFTFGIWHAVFIVSSLILNYLFAYFINRTQNEKLKKVLLIIVIILNVLALFLTKYLNFFYTAIVELFSGQGSVLNLFVPLGISYTTFQQIAYQVDTFRGETKEINFLEYSLFILFFVKSLCGPIILQSEFINQVKDDENYKVNYDNLSRGLYVFVIGLAKKVLIADTLAYIVNNGYGMAAGLSTIDALLVILSYTLQIYFDFSGCCDMACGLSQMFNLKIINNFEDPYQTNNILDFWKAWHISLTSFLRKYIYFPLGGNRKGKVRTMINVMIIFLISGLWHGANWTFIVWGALHGLASVLMRIYGKHYDKMPSIIKWIINFAFVNITWVFFRAETISDAIRLIGRIFTGGFYLSFGYIYIFYTAVALWLALSFKTKTNKEFNVNVYRMLFASAILVLCLLNFTENISFIYVNF
ncbi:MAG: MBOAT family protein [Clostridiales bacterium]|nr:MBOAT family protein [Clostridiales bacterium]